MADDSERSSDCIVTLHAYAHPQADVPNKAGAPPGASRPGQRPCGRWERRVAMAVPAGQRGMKKSVPQD
jgi:hypothetical protein